MKFFNSTPEESTSSDVLTSSSVRSSRRGLIKKAAVGAGVAVAAVVAGTTAHAFTSTTSADAASLSKHYPKRLHRKQAFWEIKSDENAHVAFLKKALGSAARPKPSFKDLYSKDRWAFELLAKTFENVGVGAYLMAAPAISNKAYLAAAGSILTIEARHAGYLDALVDVPLSPNGPFDVPLTQAQIVADVSPFVKSLNGGSSPAAPLTSDIDILNFALLLEFLEAEFYNINVPRFF